MKNLRKLKKVGLERGSNWVPVGYLAAVAPNLRNIEGTQNSTPLQCFGADCKLLCYVNKISHKTNTMLTRATYSG